MDVLAVTDLDGGGHQAVAVDFLGGPKVAYADSKPFLALELLRTGRERLGRELGNGLKDPFGVGFRN